MKKTKAWCETKIDNKKIEEWSGIIEDEVVSDEEAAEKLGHGYYSKE